MPKVSPTMTAGRLVDWKKSEGDQFVEGEDIADIESDKAIMPISARDDGYMARIFVKPDTPDIPLGELLAITVEEKEHIAAFTNYQSSQPPPQNLAPQQPPGVQAPSSPSQTHTSEYKGPLGPAIMRLLNQYPNINLNAVKPTGPKGRILKGDILGAIRDGSALSHTTPPSHQNTSPKTNKSTPPKRQQQQQQQQQQQLHQNRPYHDIPLSSMRRTIAKRLLQSKTTIPHRYTSANFQLDALLDLRKRLNQSDHSLRVSVNDFVIKAAATALSRVPHMNAFWNEHQNQPVLSDQIDISMAVAIEGGLITPIVTSADKRDLSEISRVSKDLIARAREGSLAPKEFQGGSFSISNLGMYGVSSFCTIINPPQSCNLAVGAGVKRAALDQDGSLRMITQCTTTLSTDARVVDEEVAALFLKELTICLAAPEFMLW